MVRVSVITLTWNHLEYTKKAVTSLLPILEPNDEVIFVDNNSNDGTHKYLEDLEIPCEKHLILNKEHHSITESYNQAINKSKGAFIFIYDNDMEIVEPNTLVHMIEMHYNEPKAGIVFPHVAKTVSTIKVVDSAKYKTNSIYEIRLRRKRPYPSVPSSGWLIKREVIKRVGGFDERYKGYGMLDFDYAKVVLNAGYKILLDGFVFINHYGSITAKGYDLQPQLLESRYQFYKKWDLPLPRHLRNYAR